MSSIHFVDTTTKVNKTKLDASFLSHRYINVKAATAMPLVLTHKYVCLAWHVHVVDARDAHAT